MTEPEKRAVRRAAAIAVLHCGTMPAAGTMGELHAAAHRAGLEVDRAIATWTRWRRRFDPPPDVLEVGSARTNYRYEIAKGLFEGRSETIRQLIGAAAGSA